MFLCLNHEIKSEKTHFVEFWIGEWRIQSSLSPGETSCSLFSLYAVRLGLCGPSPQFRTEEQGQVRDRQGREATCSGVVLFWILREKDGRRSGVVLENEMRTTVTGHLADRSEKVLTVADHR